jgi:arginine:agmatine antiporter
MNHASRKMSLLQATMLVAGNMIGTGLFLLPVSLASVGSISILGWVIATAGAAALGLIFAKLGELNPQEGGPYAYARDFLGPYVGFQTNYVYWFGNWIGNIAVAIAAVGYLAEFIPAITYPPASVFAAAAVIWILTFANILGPRVVGALETWTMSLALVPILGIAVFGWFWFDSATFLAGWNASGGSNAHAVSRAASMALWAFMGIESAAVSAGVIENPRRNIPLATLIGLGVAAVIYVLSSSVIMGIIPNAELQKSHAPFAEAARMAMGTWGMAVISVCAILKSLGSLGGWMLLVGQSAKAAADDGMFPSVFARMNRHGVPGRGLVIVGVLMTVVLFATMSPTIAGQFNRLIDLAVVLAVVPYIYASVALVKVIFDLKLPARTFQTFKWVAVAAVTYCLWAVVGGDPKTVVHAFVALLVSVPLYPFFIKSMEAATRRRASMAGTLPAAVAPLLPLGVAREGASPSDQEAAEEALSR